MVLHNLATKLEKNFLENWAANWRSRRAANDQDIKFQCSPEDASWACM